MEGHVAAADGCRLFARTVHAEAQDRPWLVLSNCLAADHTMWEPQLEWLAAHHRLLLYDTRGHGRSDAPAGRASFADLVSDVIALMDHCRIANASFMGLSLGGMTGLGVALAHPERLSRLVCCDARSDAPPPFASMWSARIAKIEAEGLQSLFDETLERWLSPEFRAANPAEILRLWEMFAKTAPEGYIACAHALQRLDYLKDLGRIALPTLFVAGDDDAAAPPDVMKVMADAVAGARLAIIPRARHLANIDNPSAFRNAVEAFLKA